MWAGIPRPLRSLTVGLALLLGHAGRAGAQEAPGAKAGPSRQSVLAAAGLYLEGNPELEATALDGRLRIVNVYRVEMSTEIETLGWPVADRRASFIDQVYRPYRAVWSGYVGDEEAFAAWLDGERGFAVDTRWLIPVQVDFPRLVERTARAMEGLTGREPEGTWYLLLGPGWTNLGGLEGGAMLVDFNGLGGEAGVESIVSVLPHEINHMLWRREGSNPLLARVMNEGFAVYVDRLFPGRTRSSAESLGYTAEEWTWAVDHEESIRARFAQDLPDGDQESARRYAARAIRLWPDGPGAIGYFIGLRVVESYVKEHGPGSWRDIYDLSPEEVLERSGYLEGEIPGE